MMVSKQQLSKIKVVSLDGDMTLWDFNRVMRHALGITLRELCKRFPGPNTDKLTIDTMIDIRNRTAAELTGKTIKLEEIRYQAFRNTLHCIGQDDDEYAAYLNTLYLNHRFEDVELYRDVLPSLRVLGEHYLLGICSNGNSYPERCGLSDIFDFTVFAQDVGVEKPDTRIFEEVCRLVNCTPDTMIHIGDSLINDVSGAQKAGAVAIWLNRNGIRNDTDIQPDIEIQSLTQLIDILVQGSF